MGMGSCATKVPSIPIYYLVLAMFVVAVGDIFICPTMGSEFPERECCDPVYPIPAPGPSHIDHGNIDPGYPEFVPTTPSATTDSPGQYNFIFYLVFRSIIKNIARAAVC